MRYTQTVLVLLALAVTITAQSLGPCGDGNVGVGQGGPFDLVKVNGSTGGTARRVDIPINTPLTISIDQPPTNTMPSLFSIYGMIGVPTAAHQFALPFGVGTMCFAPCPLLPAHPGLFTVTGNLGPLNCAYVDPNTATATPYSVTFASGSPVAIRFTIQGVVIESTTTLKITNGVIVNIYDPANGAQVVDTSFSMFPTVPGGGPPPIFRDEALLLELDSPVDAGILGGFVQSGPGPSVYLAQHASGAQIPYLPFANQAAARAALQLWNDGTATQVQNVIVGRHQIDPRILVIDPTVDGVNPFGLPPTLGLAPQTQYDVFIPPMGAITTGGGTSIAGFGAQPPVALPPFNPNPPPSWALVTGTSFSPDLIAPTVAQVTTQFLQGGGMGPIPHDDTVVVIFSEPIATASVDVVQNLVLRNTSITTAQDPSGVIVPTTVSSDATGMTWFLTPAPSFGAGPYTIQAEVGAAGGPLTDLAGNPLSASVIQSFTTQSAPGQPTALTVIETFDTNTFENTLFAPDFHAAEWNTNASGRLSGISISGTAAPGGTLGSRTQFPITPTLPPPVTAFFSPFDDNNINNFGPTANPNGGSRTQLLFLGNSVELPDQLVDSIELVEWGAFNGLSNPHVFNGFQMRMGHTTAQASSTFSFGLVTTFDLNFDVNSPQNDWIMPVAHPAGVPLTANEAPIPVVSPQAYSVPLLASQFIPFPSLGILFDFDGTQQELSASTNQLLEANLVLDIDIQAGQTPSNNFVLGNFPTGPTPIRRLNGAPGSTLAFNADAVAHHYRFTTVPKNSSASSLFYDLGTANPAVSTIGIAPDPSSLPGVVSVLVEGANAIAMGAPIGATSGLVTYVDRGVVNASALAAVSGFRYLRLQYEFENETSANLSPYVENVFIGFTQ